jgi:hypothetical protein
MPGTTTYVPPLLGCRATGLGVQRIEAPKTEGSVKTGYHHPTRTGTVVHVGDMQDGEERYGVAYLLCDDNHTWAVYLDGMEVLP